MKFLFFKSIYEYFMNIQSLSASAKHPKFFLIISQ